MLLPRPRSTVHAHRQPTLTDYVLCTGETWVCASYWLVYGISRAAVLFACRDLRLRRWRGGCLRCCVSVRVARDASSDVMDA